MTANLCPLTEAQHARLHPLLQANEGWVWIDSASNPSASVLDAVIERSNRSVLPSIAKHLAHTSTPEYTNTTPSIPTRSQVEAKRQ